MKEYQKPEILVKSLIQNDSIASNQWTDWTDNKPSVGVSAPNLWWPDEYAN